MSPSGGLSWYLAGLACWYASFGCLSVFYPWLVAVVLRETPERIGIAQTAAMGPAVLFMLWGGAIADRGDGRRLLAGYLALATLPPLALAAAVGAGASGYGVVLLYGAALGSLSAFAMPTQDALLSQVAGTNLPRAVAVASTMQFVFRLLGTAAAGLAAVVGTIGVLSGQAVVFALGALTVLRIPAARDGAGPRPRLADGRERVFAGLGEAVRDPRILPVLVATAAVGVLYVGAFLVFMPLLVRDAFHGGSAELALLNLCFWGGTLVSTAAQIRLRPIRRPGRAIVTALTAGALILAAMAWAPSLTALASLCLVWGMGAGVAMTQSRTVVQIAAPATHRARLLAALQLGLTGGGPVGALATGYLAGMVGPRQAVLYPAATMIAVLAVLLATTRIWSQEAATS